MEEYFGFDVKYTAKKKPYLVARIGEGSARIADFGNTSCAVLFLKLLAAYGKQEYERGRSDESK